MRPGCLMTFLIPLDCGKNTTLKKARVSVRIWVLCKMAWKRDGAVGKIVVPSRSNKLENLLANAAGVRPIRLIVGSINEPLFRELPPTSSNCCRSVA